MINLVIVKKFIIAIINFSNMFMLIEIFQFSSLIFIRNVDKVIRMYINTVIKVRMIMIVGRKIILFCRRIWIVNHFGINPRKGGIPLNDKKFRMKNIFVIILEFID